jgi:hypothetical protein
MDFRRTKHLELHTTIPWRIFLQTLSRGLTITDRYMDLRCTKHLELHIRNALLMNHDPMGNIPSDSIEMIHDDKQICGLPSHEVFGIVY